MKCFANLVSDTAIPAGLISPLISPIVRSLMSSMAGPQKQGIHRRRRCNHFVIRLELLTEIGQWGSKDQLGFVK